MNEKSKKDFLALNSKIKTQIFGSFKESSYLCIRKSPLYAEYLGQL